MTRINAMVKDGGYEVLDIPPKLMGELALSIQNKGSETVHLKSRSLEVVGFMVTGNQTGERVIILGGEQEVHDER